MDKKQWMNQVALMAAAYMFQYSAVDQEELRNAAKDIAWRSRGLSAADIRRARTLSFIWTEWEATPYKARIAFK